MTKKSSLYINNTGVVKLTGLRDHTGAYQNAATVEMLSLVDVNSGKVVAGVSLPLTLNYIAASDGEYQGLIGVLSGIRTGQLVEATVRATSGALVGEWTEIALVQKREA